MTFYNGTMNPPGYPFYGYGDHLYTTSEEERNDAIARWGYEYERVVGYVYPAGTRPGPDYVSLYRLTSDRVPCGDHFYTTSSSTRDDAIRAGYRTDWFNPQCTVIDRSHELSDSVIMYHLYLPWNGDHFYSWVTDEINDAINNHDYQYDNSHGDRQAFRVMRNSASGLMPLYRLVRTKRWESPPPPPPPPTGTEYVGLSRVSSTSFQYQGTTSDPWNAQRALITTVRNNTGYNLSLSLRDANNAFVGAIVINAGQTVNSFQNYRFQGNWTAQIGGSVTSAPSQLSIQVGWRKP
jgi:hypothetical protein